MLNQLQVVEAAASRSAAILLVLGGLVGLGCPGPEPSSSNGPTGGGASGPGGASSSSGGATGGVMNEGGTTEGPGGMGAGGSGGEDCGVRNIDANPDHCGDCFRSCAGPGVDIPICEQGLCVSTCKSGFLNLFQPDKSMPDDGCETPGLRVFVMEAPVAPIFNGDLSGADAKCQEAAESPAAGNAPALQGTWRAWLVNSQFSPHTRFMPPPPDNLPIYRVDGEPVAENFESLAMPGSELFNPIDVTESGATLMSGGPPVWIGAATVAGSGAHCNDWSALPVGLLEMPVARVGDAESKTSTWADDGQPIDCAQINGAGEIVPTVGRLYCFEQVPPP